MPKIFEIHPTSLDQFRVQLTQCFGPVRVADMEARIPVVFGWLQSLAAISTGPSFAAPDFIEDGIAVTRTKEGANDHS